MTNVLFPLSLNFYRDKPKLDSLKYLTISLVTISLSWSGREDTEQKTFQKIGLFMALPPMPVPRQQTVQGWFSQEGR